MTKVAPRLNGKKNWNLIIDRLGTYTVATAHNLSFLVGKRYSEINHYLKSSEVPADKQIEHAIFRIRFVILGAINYWEARKGFISCFDIEDEFEFQMRLIEMQDFFKMCIEQPNLIIRGPMTFEANFVFNADHGYLHAVFVENIEEFNKKK